MLYKNAWNASNLVCKKCTENAAEEFSGVPRHPPHVSPLAKSQ